MLPIGEPSVPDVQLFYPAGGLQPKEKWTSFFAFPRAVDLPTCARIIELGRRYEVENASVKADGPPPDVPEQNRRSFRDCRIRWIPCDGGTVQLFQAISEMVTVANNQHWQVDITGFVERLQFTEYDRPGTNYHWHSDTGGGFASLRKLSFSLQLSPPDSYEGGDLEFTQPVDDTTRKKFREQGTAIIFPSDLTHRVTPITKGARISLVGWVSGPPYR
jgi:PKHD-type hydroxylase